MMRSKTRTEPGEVFTLSAFHLLLHLVCSASSSASIVAWGARREHRPPLPSDPYALEGTLH